MGGNYDENSVRNEAKKERKIRNNGCDVLCICVGIGDVLLTMAMGSDDECRRQKCPTSDEEYDENTLGKVEAKDVCSYWIQVKSQPQNKKVKHEILQLYAL